jgi:diacylglycerol kinase (ATP)
MKVRVVVNPAGADAERRELLAELASRGVEAEWFETTEDDPGVGQARQAVESGADLVLACGGDGTVRACAESLVDTGVTLGVIPAGTGNLLARNKGIPDGVNAAVDVALTGKVVSMDVGRVGGEVFTVMAGAGIDAAIMNETSSDSKDRLGVAAYFIEGAKHVFDDPFKASVSVEGGGREEGEWATILVGNLGQLQGGIDLFPEAKPDDGLIDLVGLRSATAAGTVAAGVSAAVGSDESPRLFRAQSPAFEVRFEVPTRYELDGEAREKLEELRFEVVPAALRIAVPAEGANE